MLYNLLRPLLFTLPPERAHHVATTALRASLFSSPARSLARSIYLVNDPALAINRFGISFPNPIGLAAGFDKAADSFNALSALGFGFIEIGTVTANSQDGNPLPRLFRLPADKALLNRMGFNNPGAAAVADRLSHSKIEPILGVNIGKSKDAKLEDAPADYLASLELLEPHAHYITINVSSPNTPGLRSLQESEPLAQLLQTLREKAAELAQRRGELPKPILLKIAPDMTEEQLDSIIQVALSQKISGIIAANTTTSRQGFVTPQAELESLGPGGISGAPLLPRACQMVYRIYQQTSGSLPIIGVGGIFSAGDAWQMITTGASLLQLYTGFIYSGPGIVRRINRGLLRLLRQHGLHSLEDAVGLSHHSHTASKGVVPP